MRGTEKLYEGKRYSSSDKLLAGIKNYKEVISRKSIKG